MPKTVLVVDDNDNIRTIFKVTLQFKGFTVIEAGDGAEALKALAAQPVDLIVSDIAMPNMSGLELLDKVRSDPKHGGLPVIISSAEKNADEEDLLRRGATAVMPKPCRPLDLLNKVQSLLGT